MFDLPVLPYQYNALEPHLDAATMELHHSKHHQTYVTKLNEALAKEPSVANWPLGKLLTDLNQVPESIRTAVRNHGGGHFNHSLWWQILTPGGSTAPAGTLAEEINSTFGSLENLKTQIMEKGSAHFGSGWVWLARKGSALEVLTTANQDNPLSQGAKPLLGIDLWEHSYYLKFQNRRPEYLETVWQIVNWDVVAKN